MKRKRDNQRIENALNELVKIKDDGHDCAVLSRIIEDLMLLLNDPNK